MILPDINIDDPFYYTKMTISLLQQQTKEQKKNIEYLKNLNASDQEEIRLLHARIDMLEREQDINGADWLEYNGMNEHLKEGKKYYVLVNGKVKRYRWNGYHWWKGMAQVDNPSHWLYIHKPNIKIVDNSYRKFLIFGGVTSPTL